MAIGKPGVRARAHLKRATQEAHEMAEARWTKRGAFADRTGYDAWLERMHQVHAGLGQAAADTAGWLHGPGLEVERTASLRRDLSTGTMARPHSVPHLSADAAWGALYALNGSALGASHLLRTEITAQGWPVNYLREMAGFAKSGKLGAFFEKLDARTGDPEAAVTGALIVFEEIAA